jgi:hypothetical protein
MEDDDKGTYPVPPEWIPPETYALGPIPGVPPEVAACFPDTGMVHEYVWWASQCTYTNPIYHVGACLPMLAWDLAYRGWGFSSRGNQIALQTFLIGDSSSGKSTALRLARMFHEEILAKTITGWPQPPSTADARTKEVASENTARLNPWVLAHGTASGLLEQLFDHFNEPTGTTPVILWHEEVSQLLDKRKDHSIASILLELFDFVPKVERHLSRYRDMVKKGKTAPNIVYKPAISGLFAGTPASLQGVLDRSSFEGGLISRSLWLTGQPDIARWRITDRNRSVARGSIVDRWIHYAHHHHGLEARVALANAPRLLHVPADVKQIAYDALWPAFAQARKLGNGPLAAVHGRALEHAELVGALYAWSRGQTAVSEADMRAAVALLRWSTRTVERMNDSTADDANWIRSQDVLRIIDQAGLVGIKKSDISITLKMTKTVLDPCLDQLLDAGQITEHRHHAGGRGRPATVYRHVRHQAAIGNKVVKLTKLLEKQPEDEPE